LGQTMPHPRHLGASGRGEVRERRPWVFFGDIATKSICEGS